MDDLDTTLTTLIKTHGAAKLKEIIDSINKRKNGDDTEFLLDENQHRFTAFPLKNRSIWELYKVQLACMWKAEEIDFSNDYKDFKSLNPDEQHFIEMVLAFFAASDGIVNFNLSQRFTQEIQILEALFAYQFQIMMENIHSETYSLQLDNIVRDPERKAFLFNAIETVPSVKMLSDWALKWIDSSENFAHRVVAFAIVEAVFFSGAFASIFWLKKYKNNANGTGNSGTFMNGLVMSNKFIARDEGLHTRFACEMYKMVKNKMSQNEYSVILKDAVKISKCFMTDALPVRLIGMNSESMNDYIEYVADRLSIMLGYTKIYNKKNPFDFMDTIGLDDKSNFHEVRPSEYQDSHVMNKTTDRKIVIDGEF